MVSRIGAEGVGEMRGMLAYQAAALPRLRRAERL